MIGLFRRAIFVLTLTASLAMPVYASEDKSIAMEKTPAVQWPYAEIERLSPENFLRIYALEAEVKGDRQSASIAIITLLVINSFPWFCAFLGLVVIIYVVLRILQIKTKDLKLTPQQKAEIGKIVMSEVSDDLLKAQLLNAFLVHNEISGKAELKDDRKTAQTIKDENTVTLLSQIDDANLKTLLITALLIENENIPADISDEIKKVIETKLEQSHSILDESKSTGISS